VITPAGSEVALDYSGAARGETGGPVLACRIQALFGLKETPCVARGQVPVTIHLLAPNGRPCQVTQDLASFWQSTYAEVRKALKGRYPKHYWPEDPYTATPTSRVRPKGSR
jgi:ATP-dependent helicase HrpB